MPEYEELLAALADGEEQEAPPQDSKPESNTLKQVRDALKRAKAEETKARQERDEALSALQTRIDSDATAVLQSAGLTDKQAEVFRKSYDDVTSEAIAALKTDVLGQTVDENRPTSMAPLNLGGESPSKRYSKDDFKELMKSNPNLAWQVAEKGLVDL